MIESKNSFNEGSVSPRTGSSADYSYFIFGQSEKQVLADQEK